MALLHELEPRDAVESVLCSQMIVTHLQTMECYRRANLTGQSMTGTDLCLHHAERLSRIFTQQVGCVPFFLNRAMTFIAARALPAKVPSDGLPARLYHRRRELRLTKVEVAKMLGVTPGIIRRWEEAEHPPSAKHVPAIVDFLGDDDWLEARSFCQRLARFRKLRGWSQLQMSQSLNCAESSVRMWERGVRPSRSMQARIEGHICA